MRMTHAVANHVGAAALALFLSSATAFAQEFPGTYIQIPGPLGFSGVPFTPTNITANPATDYVFLARQTNGTMSGVYYLPLSSFASGTDIANVNARIDQAFQQINHGVTAAVSLPSIFMPSAPGRTSWAVNAGTFSGDVGAGFSLAHRFDVSVPLAITASYSYGGGSANVARLGLMGEF